MHGTENIKEDQWPQIMCDTLIAAETMCRFLAALIKSGAFERDEMAEVMGSITADVIDDLKAGKINIAKFLKPRPPVNPVPSRN